MGVYIKNMEKPKKCVGCPIDERWCKLWKDFDSWDVETHPDCPLIEIDLVRCGECKWFLKGEGEYGKCKYRIRPILYCLPTDFCSYGERSADES